MPRKQTRRNNSGKGPSQRQLRVGEVIRHALSSILMRDVLKDPALVGVSITVSEVRASADLRYAKVFCAPLGGTNQDEVVKALNKSAGYLRSLLGSEVSLKNTPELSFVSDLSFDEAVKIDQLLRSDRVSHDLTQNDQASEDPVDDSPDQDSPEETK